MQRLRMLRRRPPRRSQRRPQHHRHFPRSARHVVDLRRLIHHLVHRQRQKIAEHDIHHRPHSRHRRPNTHARKSRFRNRRVNHPLGSKLFHQARKHFDRRPRFRNVLAQYAHPRIAPHFFRQRFPNRLCECQLPRSCLRHTRPGPLPRVPDTAPQSQTPPPFSSPPSLRSAPVQTPRHPPAFPPAASPQSS